MMKKNIPYLIAIAVCVLITIASVAVACANSTPAGAPADDTSDVSGSTGSETLEVPSHNAFSESTESESATEITTEVTSETMLLDDEDHEIETTSPQEINTEAKEDTTVPEVPFETEPETETEIPTPVISLEFESNGNGTCAVVGIGNVTDSYIVIPLKSPDGDVVTAISDRAFYGNPTIRAIEIPSTVATIGELAFSDCPELVYISVDKENKLFTDVGGILFSLDMKRVLAFPAASGASSITIPKSIEKIEAMAFYGCNNLKTINYEGSLSAWSEIEIGDMNYGLYTASIICSETEE